MTDTIERNAHAQVRRREANERVADVYYNLRPAERSTCRSS